MAKNKGTHGRGKASASTLQPDEFVQTVSSVSETLQPHLTKIAIGVGIAVAGLGAWKFIEYRHEKSSMEATSTYLSALSVNEAVIVGPGDTDPNILSPVPVLTYPDEESRRKASFLAWEKAGKTDLPLASLVVPRQAKLLLEDGKYDEAIAAYRSFSKSSAPENLRMTALEGIGYSLEAKAMDNEDPAARQTGLESALTAYTELQPSIDGELRDYSLYHQGRILALLGKSDEAVIKFKQVLSENPGSALKPTIEGRLVELQPGNE